MVIESLDTRHACSKNLGLTTRIVTRRLVERGDQGREDELELAWVLGTDGSHCPFGRGTTGRAVDVPGFSLAHRRRHPGTRAETDRPGPSEPIDRHA
jgi:hypothetical protein